MIELHRAGWAFGLAASLSFACSARAQEPAVAETPSTQLALSLVSDGVAAKPVGDPSCPTALVASGGGAFPKRDDAYKATLGGLARDCANLGAETILKVALVGEGERDNVKGPSWFNAPIRMQVKDASGATVETRKIKLRVTLPSGEERAAFRHLEENVSLPPSDTGYAGWSVEVGFDASASIAPANAKRKAPRRSNAVRSTPPRVEARAYAAPLAVPPNLTSPWQKVASPGERRSSPQGPAVTAPRR